VAKSGDITRPVRPVKRVEARDDGDEAPQRPTIPIREVDEDESVNVPRLKPKPKLRRPDAPPTPTKETESKDSGSKDDGDSISVIGVDPLDLESRLRRPSPPRHKRKEREDEDDEMEMREKAGKVSKTKRRGQAVLEDEDEDLDALADELDGEEQSTEAMNLSMSLARPPKPKSAGSGKPSTPTVKSHRPQHRDSGGSGRGRRDRRESAPKQERPELIVLTEGLTVHELAEQIMVPDTELIKSLFFKGIAANINQTLDIETAKMVAEEFDVIVETEAAQSEAKKVTEMIDAADLENLQRRPPVVTIMGHVDHGKTTLLDAIRKTKVAQGEAGGITQHIGAYHVDVEHAGQSHQIVFLDTPGHEAFTAMRARGTRVTDIAILVVAADDGVRPQTIEAISHAKAAEVPLIVAINKVDKETANPDRVKQELMEHSLVPEEWGGDTIMVPVSALSGENLDTLLEMIVLVAEVEDLQANPDRRARGTVIEANLDKARGPVATLLVQNGTLKVGDSLVAGPVLGKVRAMLDDRLQRVDKATPSFAVEVLGLNDVPAAGDEFEVYPDEKTARAVADKRMSEQRMSRLQQAMASRRVTLNTISAQVQEGDLKDLNLLLKADVQGSIEAILAALQQLPQNEVQIRVLLAAPGEISETDVDLAAASGAVIVGFNTTLAPGARQSADRLGVDVRDYDVIYNLLDDIQGAMEGLLDPEMVEETLGQVEVRAVFPVRKGAVAGCYVLSGKVTRNCNLRVVRGGEVVYTGKLDSLKRMKEDAKDVAAGFECGIGIDSFSDWKESDIIDAFRMVTKRRTLAMT
jgi:translation initiation factor IF-2